MALQVGAGWAKEGKDRQDASTKRITRKGGTRHRPGRGQLSLVEHALCPLDTAVSLNEGFVHEVEYLYADGNRHTKRAKVKIVCPSGLSPSDEFYLWGLLALTFQQPEPSGDFYATPHYVLKELDCLEAGSERTKGGEELPRFPAVAGSALGGDLQERAFLRPDSWRASRGEFRSSGIQLANQTPSHTEPGGLRGAPISLSSAKQQAAISSSTSTLTANSISHLVAYSSP